MVDWEELGYELLPSASNGEEGLEGIRKYKPELVITDIKMPRLDGVGVIRTCKEEGLKSQFIVLSSYNDFPLVKEVMKLGVVDYLMKVNISQDELEALLLETKKLLELQQLKEKGKEVKNEEGFVQEQRQVIEKERLRNLIFGTIDRAKAKNEIQQESLEKDQKAYYVLTIALTKGVHEDYVPYFMNLCREVLEEFARGEIFFQSEERFVVYTEGNKEEVITLSKRFHYLLKQYFNLKAVIGASKKYKNPLDLHEAYKQSKEATLKASWEDEEMVLYFYIQEQEAAVQQGEWDLAKVKVEKAKQYIQEKVYEKISLCEVAAFLDITPSYLSTIFKREERKAFSDYVAEVKVEKAKELFVLHAYKVYEVSLKVGYEDPYYFSKVFKKITGVTPTEFICKRGEGDR